MKLKLNEHLINHLQELPEPGMGHQLVNIALKNGKELQNISAFNCEEIVLPSKCPAISPDNIEKIQLGRAGPSLSC